MSYQVLARKWRPQNFDDLVGQEHVSRTLANAIHSGRVHHAFLFTGARGVGKTSAARILAKALNCEQGLTSTPCNICPSCIEITNGQGIDVFEIDGASNTGVDDIRELRENIRYLPSRSRFKIFIIDEVHMLSINAFNALLKTLEEPPAHAKFIFATTEPHKIPSTILSRCQRFDFRKIALAPVVARLRRIVDDEGIVITDLALTLVARRGEGSMRDSLSTLDQVIAFCGETVLDEDVQGLLGLVDRRLLLDAIEGIVRRDSRLALETLRRVDEQGYAFRQFCQELVEGFRTLVLLSVLSEPGGLLDVTAEELQQLQALASLGTVEDHQRALTVLVRCEAELPASSFPRLTLEMALVRLCHLPASREIGALIHKIEELEHRLASRPVGAAVRPAVPPPATKEMEKSGPRAAPQESLPEKKPSAPRPNSDAGQRDWVGLIAWLRQARRPRLVMALEQASVLVCELPLLRLGLAKGSFALDTLQGSATLNELRQLAAEYFATPVDLQLVALEQAVAAQAPPSLQQARQEEEEKQRRQLREEATSHPLVRAACEILGGEIVAINPLAPAPESSEQS